MANLIEITDFPEIESLPSDQNFVFYVKRISDGQDYKIKLNNFKTLITDTVEEGGSTLVDDIVAQILPQIESSFEQDLEDQILEALQTNAIRDQIEAEINDILGSNFEDPRQEIVADVNSIFDNAITNKKFNKEVALINIDLKTLNEETLPELQEELSNLNDVILPQVQLDLEGLDNSLTNLNDVILPQVQNDLTDLSQNLDDLNDNIIPQIQLELENLGAVDLTQLQNDLDIVESDIQTLNDTTIPALNDRLSDAEIELENLGSADLTQLQDDLDAVELDIQTLNNTTIPNLQGEIDTLNNSTIPDLELEIQTLNDTTIPDINQTLEGVSEDLAFLEEEVEPEDVRMDIVEGVSNILNTALADRQTKKNILSIQEFNKLFPVTETNISDDAITTPKIRANTIQGYQIQANSIVSEHIVAGSITAASIASFSIVGDKIAANTISGDKLIVNSITASLIAAGAVTTGKMTANSINGDRITANTLDADKIVANSITADHIAALSIGAGELSADSITSSKIVSGAVTTDKMTANSINGDRIAANTLSADKIIANSITSDHIAALSIGAGELAANSITSSKIEADAITSVKIVAGAITTDKMLVNSINGDRITVNTISADKIVANSITTDQIAANSVNGDRITTNTLGADKIVANSITTDHIAANSVSGDRITVNTLNGNRIVANSISADKIVANSITASQIASETITGDLIQANSIDASHIQANAVETDAIKAGAIVADKIAVGTITGELIAGQTIAAKNLLVTDFTNLVEGSDWEDDSRINWSGLNSNTLVSTDDSYSGNRSLKALSNASQRIITYNVEPSVSENEKLYVELYLKTTSDFNGSSGGSKIRFGDAQSNNDLVGDVNFTNTSNSWSKITGEISCPTNTNLQIQLWFDHSAGTVYVDDVVVKRKSGGNLIIDGAITAEKIAAGAITATKISTDALDGKLITGTILRTSSSTSTPRVVIGDPSLPIWYGTGTISTANGSFYANNSGTIYAKNMVISGTSVFSGSLSGTIVNGSNISTGAITATKIASSAITSDKINANAITAAKIASGAVTADKISATAIDGKTITGSIIRTASGTAYRAELQDDGTYMFWIGNGAKNDSNALFYVKKNGNGFLRGNFLAGQLSREKYAEGTNNNVSVLHNDSAGYDVVIISTCSYYRFYTSSSVVNSGVRTMPWTLKRGATTISSGNARATISVRQEGGEYLVQEFLEFNTNFIDTGNSSGDLTYTFEIENTTGTGVVYKTSILTRENLIG